MKTKARTLRPSFLPAHIALSLGLAVVGLSPLGSYTAQASTDWTGATDTSWGTSGNWSSVAPTSADTVLFGPAATSNLATTLSGDTSIRGLSLTSPSGAVSIGNNTLTLGSGGIDMSSAGQDLTITSALTIDAGNQVWNVGSGRTLTLQTGAFSRSAGATLNVQGAGTVTTMTNLSTGSLVNGIIGPWASFGTGTSLGYATINGSNQIAILSGATAYGTGGTSATTNYDAATATYALSGNRSVYTIRETGVSVTIKSSNTSNPHTLTCSG